MTRTKTRNNPWPDFETPTEDGRRRRSDRSRHQIIVALFDLVGEGDMTPTAQAVAQRAGVGLRTVFRHFEDMDSLFEEMTEELMAIYMPKVVAPFEGKSWRDRLIELADRNTQLFEQIFPWQVALMIRRFQSPFLQKQYQRELMILRSSLKAILPKEVVSNQTLFAALEVNLAFATWRRLREEQGLSVELARKTLKMILTSLIASTDVD